MPVPLQIKTKFLLSRGYLTEPSDEEASTVCWSSIFSNKRESGLLNSGLYITFSFGRSSGLEAIDNGISLPDSDTRFTY